MNQKWEAFKQELDELTKKEETDTYEDRLNKFYDFIQPHTNKEIKYGSSLYKKISKKLTEFGLRFYKEQTVYQIIKYNKIPFKYVDDNLVILGVDKNDK